MWPDDGTSLPVRVEAAFGDNPAGNPGLWTWTDLSSRLQGRSIQWREGRSSGARNVSPGTLTVDLDNDDGALTPLHPLSTYWPYVRRNTPIRVSVFWGGVWRTLLSRFADQWKPGFRPTTGGKTVSVVQVTASGLLRRLEQGVDPLFSAPRRYIPTTNPIAYWPLEDGQLASEGAALVGGQPMRPFVGSHPAGNVITFARWGRGDLAPWLPGGVSRAGSAGLTAIWAPVSMTPAPARWTVDFMYRSGTDAGVATVDVNPSYLPGGGLGWPQLYLEPSTQSVLVAMNGEPEVDGSAESLYDGLPHHVRWDVVQSGSKVAWTAHVDGALVNSGTTSGNMTLPSMQTLAFTADAQNGADMAQGHIAVWSTTNSLPNAVAAAFGHSGETAAARVTRLCAEESISVAVGSGESEPMGPQTSAPLVELLREAEDADVGLLYESGFGLAYRPRGDRYDAPVDLTIDLATYRTASGTSAEVLAPTYDDRGVRNRWTTNRPDGGTVTVDDATHQDQFGVYRDSATLNLPTDARLTDQAGWRTWLGTVEVLREDTFPIDLRANPGLIPDVLDCVVGSRIVRTHPPATYGPGPLDTLVDGLSGSIGPRSWLVNVTPSPASPWFAATVDGDPRAPADGSTLTVALSSAGTSLTLNSTVANRPWTEDPADFPLAMQVGGEQVTASAIGPAAADDFTRVVAPGGWGGSWVVASGASSAASTNNVGILDVPALSAEYSLVLSGLAVEDVEVDVGAFYLATAPTGSGAYARAVVYLRYQNASNYLALLVHALGSGAIDLQVVRVAGGSFSVLGAASSPTPFVPGVSLKIRVAADSFWVRARVWTFGLYDPLGWQITAIDPTPVPGTVGLGALLPPSVTNTLPYRVVFDGLTVLRPQLVTMSARGVAGVQRAWPALTPVDVSVPAISPL